jgi:rare lipoprotein A (peptidoglycan hydrolase)
MVRWLILCAAVFVFTGNIFAQQTDVWEGNATVVSEGVFEEKGLFAASNAFPENTIIQVENPRTGKTVKVTVVKRIIDNPNLFLLLSGQAADLLEMEKGDVERVKIHIAADLVNQIPSMLDESLITQDPDLNPAAVPPSLAEASTPLEPEIKIEEEVEEAAAADEAEAAEVEEAEVEEAAAALTEAEKLAERAAARTPQKDFFQPPKEAQEVVSPEVAEADEPPVEEPEAEDLTPDEQETESAEVSISEEPKVQEKLLDEGPEPTLAPPSVEEPVLAFSEIKPQPPVHAGEEIPEPAVEPPAPEESITPFSAVSPESPLLADTSDMIEVTRPETAALDESLLYLVPPEYFIEESLEMAQPDTVPEAETLLAETSHEPSPPLAAEDKAAIPPEEEVEPELAEEVKPAEIEAPVVTEGPAVAEAGKELVLESTEPKPPGPIEEEKAVAEPAAAEVVAAEPEEAEKPVTSGELTVRELPADYAENRTYFIQLAAYNSVELAKKLETTYSDKYPIAILAAKPAKGGLYRVLIGPLNEDETGTLLTWFQAKGFDDAFVRSVN